MNCAKFLLLFALKLFHSAKGEVFGGKGGRAYAHRLGQALYGTQWMGHE